MAVCSRFGVRKRLAQAWGPGDVAIRTGHGEVGSGGFHYQTPSLPASTWSNIPQPQDAALCSSKGVSEARHRRAFLLDTRRPSTFPDPSLPPHFIFTSLWAPAFPILDYSHVAGWETLILTAGARAPLRSSCLCWGKYYCELQGRQR